MITYQMVPDNRNSTGNDLRWKVVRFTGSSTDTEELIEDNLTEEEATQLRDKLNREKE